MPVVPQAARRPRTIANRLEQAILSGEFRPKERLPAERTLAERWKVSRATVREAIAELATRGLLVRRQGDGTYLNDAEQRLGVEVWADMASRHPDLQRHVLEFRQMLERRAAELAALRHKPADRRRLEKAQAAVDTAFVSGDTHAQIEADMTLHRVIAECTHNPVFRYLMKSLQDVMRDHMKLTLAGSSRLSPHYDAVRGQHARLVGAILKRDAVAAARASEHHLEYVRVHFNQL
jgi:GntR family transcriptional repressor for pyruvate dehydrogenase complex